MSVPSSGYVDIYSNDGSTILYSNIDDFSGMSVTVTSTGATISSEYVNDTYTYTGDKNFLGLAVTANATAPDYENGDTAGDHTFAVKAKADGYTDSDYSNEVTYTKL